MIVIAGVVAVVPDDVFAYDAATTHQALTQEIVRLYNLIHPDRQIDAVSLENILKGSVEEDAPPRWINHFYNPLTKTGWTGDNMGAFPSSVVRLFSFIGISSEEALSAIDWIKNNIIQDKYSSYGGSHTWKMGLKAYAAGNMDAANQTLGHILHILEDLGVPDHTRDDTHAQELAVATGDAGSPYEDYAIRFTPQIIALANTIYKENAPIVAKQTPEEYLESMAAYSNKYFFSKDTINSASFPSPRVFESDCDSNGYCYEKDGYGEKTLVALYKKEKNDNGQIIGGFSLLNKEQYYPILESYFSHLSKKILLHGVGLVELFYKQGNEEKENQQYPQHLVTYDFSAITPPAFSLVGTGQAIANTAQALWGSVASAAQGTLAWAQSIWNRFSGSQASESLALISARTATTTAPPQTKGSSINGTTTQTDTPPQQPPQISESSPAADAAVYAARVIDGDTIVLTNGTVVRYIGIDAPEIAYQENTAGCYADQARDKNKLLLDGKPLRLEFTNQTIDKYDRTLAYVWTGNTLVNAELVAGGYAYAYNFGHAHPKEADFLALQETARSKNLGLWGAACPHKSIGETTSTTDPLMSNAPRLTCLFASSTSRRSDTAVALNEIAWMGSTQNAANEWIEIKNRGTQSIDVRGWAVISERDGLSATLPAITLAPGQLLLLERTDDNTVPDKKADALYTGALANSNTGIKLIDESCRIIDDAYAHPSWQSGDAAARRTMERDAFGSGWHASAPINGTPKENNSSGYALYGGGGTQSNGAAATPTSSSSQPQWAPVTINEIYYDAPGSDESAEWIELYNAATSSVSLDGWKIEESGTAHTITPQGTVAIAPGGYAVIARNKEQFLVNHPDVTAPIWTSAFSLNNDGEIITLKNNALAIDTITYASTTGAAGNGKSLQKFDATWKEAAPTPGKENKEDALSGQPATPVDYLVISEIQVAGQSANDEFIELYNPTDAAISLHDYSLQYLSGKATTTQRAYKELFSGTAAVAPHGFFLLARSGGIFEARADMSYNGFSLSGATTGGIIVLTRATGTIESLTDTTIVDLLAYGAPSLASDNAAPLPSADQSIERRALESGVCVLATNTYEFSGNGCDTDTATLDFDVRQTPKPQNTANLPEPRTAPAMPEHFSASFETSSLTLALQWSGTPASDILYYLKDISAQSTNPRIIATTTQTLWHAQMHDVGYEAMLSLTACDEENFCSDDANTTIAIPSPLTSFAVYKDPRAENRYAVDMTYAAYPFIPNLYASPPNNRWKIMALYLNQDAPQTPETTDDRFRDLSGTLSVAYPRCTGGTTPGAAVLMPDTSSNCSINGGIYNASMGFGTQQETHLNLTLAQTPQDLSLSPDDFVTIAFYDFYDFMPSDGTVGYFKLAAVDKTHYHITNAPPVHQPPTLEGALVFSFNQTMSELTARWPLAVDTDTAQSTIEYEIRYRDGAAWTNTGTTTSHTTTTAAGDVLNVSVRAIDDFKNVSAEISGSWSYPTTTPTITQTIADGWSNIFGQRNQNQPPWSAPGPAIFQSITPQTPLSFNAISVRIKQDPNLYAYPATLKLGIYTDASGSVDWRNKIGEAFSAELNQPNPENDITFVFSSPIRLEERTSYWLALEVAAYNAYYQDYAWQGGSWHVAIASTDPYPNGTMAYGWGNPCTDPSSCTPGTIQSSNGTDWYMTFATRE